MARSIRRNFVYNVLYNLLQVAIPLVTTPYLSRVLGPDGIGVYSFTNTIAGYFVLFSVLGMSTYGVRTTAQAQESKETLSHTFCDVYISQLIVGLAVMVAYVLYAFVFGADRIGLFLLWLPLVVSSVLDISWFLFGMEDFGFTTLRSLVVRLVGVILIFSLVKSSGDLWKYVAISAGIALANALALWPRALTYIDLVKPSWSRVRDHFVANLGLFIPVIAISLYNSLDKIMLGVMRGTTEVGFYEYAGKLTSLTASVIGAMGTVMLPRVSAVLAGGRKDEAKGLIETSLWLMLVLAIAFSCGLMAIAPVFVPVFFGNEFLPCVLLMSVLATTIPLLSMSNVLGRQWLLPNQGDALYTRSVCIGAAVDVLLNLVAIPTLGALGASLSTVVAELSVVVSQAMVVRGDLPLRRYLTNALPFVAIGAVMFMVVRLVGVSLPGEAVSVGRLALEIIIGAGVYGALAFLYCIARKDAQFKRVFGKYAKLIQKQER